MWFLLPSSSFCIIILSFLTSVACRALSLYLVSPVTPSSSCNHSFPCSFFCKCSLSCTANKININTIADMNNYSKYVHFHLFCKNNNNNKITLSGSLHIKPGVESCQQQSLLTLSSHFCLNHHKHSVFSFSNERCTEYGNNALT